MSRVPQGFALRHLLLNNFINDLCTTIRFANFLLFADHLKTFGATKSAEHCKLLQSDIHSIQK
jgi:hypothetical protein